jgi:hypothetical protein
MKLSIHIDEGNEVEVHFISCGLEKKNRMKEKKILE